MCASLLICVNGRSLGPLNETFHQRSAIKYNIHKLVGFYLHLFYWSLSKEPLRELVQFHQQEIASKWLFYLYMVAAAKTASMDLPPRLGYRQAGNSFGDYTKTQTPCWLCYAWVWPFMEYYACFRRIRFHSLHTTLNHSLIFKLLKISYGKGKLRVNEKM